ncbi:MAG: acetylglutamate kinase [Candidatus Margulisiibacteriota bacterium]
MYSEHIIRAKILLEALPYIKKFFGKTILIKFGGSLMDHEDGKRSFATDVVLLKYIGMNPVVVHGGGKEISKWMDKLGKQAVFIDGLRYTDDETMEITEMVLTGKINSELVSLINQNGGKAIGLSGKDSDIFVGKRIRSKDDQDLGAVGVVESVDASLIETLCQKGYIPVISSVGNDKEGDRLNMNADHVAAQIAKALKAEKLIFMTDVQGIRLDGVYQSVMTLPQALTAQQHPDVKGGMLPKLQEMINAVKGGVSSVHIIDGNIEHAVLLELFTNVGIGTMITGTENA